MAKKAGTETALSDAELKATLHAHLADIENEETPERLLALAQRLQRLLRDNDT